MRRTAVVATALIVLSLAMLLAQQAGGVGPQPPAPQPTDGTAAVSGVVTDATTKQPISGVMIYLGFQGRGAVGRLSRQISDARGRFVFTDLPAGNNYFINASKPGYMEGHHGVGAGGLLGGLITLTDGQWVADANVVMMRPGAITGLVTDERGEPAVGAFVRVLARINVAGRPRLAAGRVVKTDDRGAYRISELTPGRYVVQVPAVQQTYSATLTPASLAGLTPEQAAGRALGELPLAIDLPIGARLIVGNYLPPPPPVDGRPHAYPPLFHPGVTNVASASTIDLRAGEERAGVNIALQSVPATSISGVMEAPAGATITGSIVRLLAEGLEELGLGSEIATSTIAADGRFTFANVPAGSYTIDVRRSISEFQYRPSLVTSVSLPVSPGLTGISGGAVSAAPDGSRLSTNTARADMPFFAQQKITVDAKPVSDLVVPLRRGSTIRGRYVMENGEAPPVDTLNFASAQAESADGNSAMGRSGGPGPTAPSNTFELVGLGPGAYFLRFSILAGNGLAMSVMGDDGVDHRLKPFDTTTGRDYNVTVTLTTRRIDVSGPVADSSGAQVKNAIVIAFPFERDQWTNYGLTAPRIKSTPTTSSGTYRFQSLTAGEYYIVAVPPDQGDAWMDPAKLARLAAQAARLSLTWGDTKVQSVTVMRLQ